MATSWFKFNKPGVTPLPNTNPLSYTQAFTAPPLTTGTQTVAFIFATTQIISGITRPVIPASVSPTGSVTAVEINADVLAQSSSANCYMLNP